VTIVAEDVRLVDRRAVRLRAVHALSDLVVAKRVIGDLRVAVFRLRLAQRLRVARVVVVVRDVFDGLGLGPAAGVGIPQVISISRRAIVFRRTADAEAALVVVVGRGLIDRWVLPRAGFSSVLREHHQRRPVKSTTERGNR
jgi:hypothetical protein